MNARTNRYVVRTVDPMCECGTRAGFRVVDTVFPESEHLHPLQCKLCADATAAGSNAATGGAA